MEEKNYQATVSRREVLKALAAAGGALAAAAFLPGRWSKPLVETGVLPAHAQGSICSGATLQAIAGGLPCESGCQGFAEYAIFNYAPKTPGETLTPDGVILAGCNHTFSTGFSVPTPGTLYMYYNVADIANCPTRTVTITFAEGCQSDPFVDNSGQKLSGKSH